MPEQMEAVAEPVEIQAPEVVYEIDRVAVQIVMCRKDADGHKLGEVSFNPVNLFYPHRTQFDQLLDAAIVQAYEQAGQAGG